MVEDRTRELKETHSKMLHQDKMASLGKLSASVVHEINNPISGILSLVMLMNRIMEGGTLQEKDMQQFKQYLRLMETETGGLAASSPICSPFHATPKWNSEASS